MSLWSLQKWLLMLLFHFTVEQRGESFTLLVFFWSTMIQITDGFLGRCSSVEPKCGFTRGLMKTWHPSRLESVLRGCQLMYLQANLQMSTLLMVWGILGWKVFTWETKPNLSGWVHRLGAWEVEQWCGREVGRRREAYIWKMFRWLPPGWGWSGPRTEQWLSQLLGAHALFFFARG